MREKLRWLGVGAMLLGCIFLSCPAWSAAQATPATPVPIAGGPVAGPKEGPAPSYQDITDLIAGNPMDPTVAAKFVNPGGWQDYQADIGQIWNRFEQKSLKPMRAWAGRELGFPESVAGTVFYPFSGPDVINMLTFFPQAQTYLMLALEPVGTLPVFRPGENEPFFQGLEEALRELLQFNFFFTKRMEKNLVKKELDGVLPVLLFFLGREQVKVQEITFWRMGPDGSISAKPAVPGEQLTGPGIDGVKIVFRRQEGAPEQTLYYFRFNLLNTYWRQHPQFVKFLETFAPFQTFVKAASYLMFKPRFGDIRQFILAHSQLVLQTDEGIPLKYIDAAAWDRRFFGKYTCPIKLFSNCQQPDLAQIYQNGVQVQPLPFGIGYHHRRQASNLLLARKKSPGQEAAAN